MKSYKHLYEELISEENIENAIHNAFKGRKKKRRAKYILDDIPRSVRRFQRISENYHNSRHNPKEIYDGVKRKKRTIIVPTCNEQVMHHMLMQVTKPIFMRRMYEHSYGSIPGRGAHLAKKHIVKWLDKSRTKTKYCLQMDIKKFFDSIPLDILKHKLSKIIADEQFLDILFTIIDVQEVGLPLGFYTSQWLANFYLTDLDHAIKETMHASFYVRYMDDMVIFSGSKEKLHQIKTFVESYLEDELGLELKDNWQIFRMQYTDAIGRPRGRVLDFMGFKFHRFNTSLRKSIRYRIRRKAKRIDKKSKLTVHDSRQFMSYIGWIEATDSYSFYLKYVKPHVKISKLKRKLSKCDKERRPYVENS